jgi:hypothetical protein
MPPSTANDPTQGTQQNEENAPDEEETEGDES